jgi:hypothetical protein
VPCVKKIASGDVEAVSDEDIVEILSSDDNEEDEGELSPEDEEHYSYSDEDELEEEEEEEFKQNPDGQRLILDDDDDGDVVEHSKESRWVDELDEAYLTRHERHYHDHNQKSQEIEAAQEDSQEEDVVNIEEDDDVVEEVFDGDDDEDVTGEPQVDEDEEEVSPEELRRQRNEMNRQLRGQMSMSLGMGMGMSGVPRYGQRHPLGPMEPLDLEDDEEDEIAEGVSGDEDTEGVDEYEDSNADEDAVQELIEDGEEYPTGGESFEGEEGTYRDEGEPREIHDDGASSGGESEVESPPAQTPQQPDFSSYLSYQLEENLRHLQSAMPPPQERYASPGDNVVMLLDSDEEEEEETPQDDNEPEDDDAEQGELVYEGDSQDDQEGEYKQDLEDEYDQHNLTAQEGNSWEDGRNRDEPEEIDILGSNIVEADSTIQIVGDGISRDRYAHGVAESRSQESQGQYDQFRAFTSSSSSLGFGEAGSHQSPASDNVRLHLESYPAQETDQDGFGDVVQESVKSGDPQSLVDGVQDEEMLSQPASPAGESEVEQRSQPMKSGDDHNSYDSDVVVDSSDVTDTRDGLSRTDVIMTEIADYQELPLAPEFDTASDTVINREQPEVDLPSAGVIEDETEDYEELQQMSEGDARTNAGTSQVQADQVMTAVPADSGAALIDEAYAATPLKQQEVQPVIGIDDEHGSEVIVTPDAQPESFRTPLLDKLHSIAQEENIDLGSSARSTLSTSIELYSTPTFMSSGFMQSATSVDSIESSIISPTEPGTSSTNRSDLSPDQPRRTRLARMSTMAQTVRDGQAYMDQLAARSSPNSSKSNSSSTADSHSMDSSSSPSLKRGSAGSSHGRTSANMVLLVKEAREFCAGGPSRVGSGLMEEDPARDMTLSEETGGQAVVGQEDRASSAGSQPSTPHKSGVVDLVAELVIQSKVKGHHALRINPSSPGRSPVINSPSRSSSQEPNVISPMVPQYPLSQPPPHPPLGSSSTSVFTFGQGSPSKSIPASPSVGFGFGSSFVTTSKERRTSIGSASSKASPRKGSGLGSLVGHSRLDSEDAIRTTVEPVLPEVAEVEEAAAEDHQDQEMEGAEETVGMVEIENPGQVIEFEADYDRMAGEKASSSLAVGVEEESDNDDESEDEDGGEEISAMTVGSADDKGKREKAGKKGKGKKLAPKVQAKRLKRRELFWQKKQQEKQQQQGQPLPPQE